MLLTEAYQIKKSQNANNKDLDVGRLFSFVSIQIYIIFFYSWAL